MKKNVGSTRAFKHLPGGFWQASLQIIGIKLPSCVKTNRQMAFLSIEWTMLFLKNTTCEIYNLGYIVKLNSIYLFKIYRLRLHFDVTHSVNV